MTTDGLDYAMLHLLRDHEARRQALAEVLVPQLRLELRRDPYLFPNNDLHHILTDAEAVEFLFPITQPRAGQLLGTLYRIVAGQEKDMTLYVLSCILTIRRRDLPSESLQQGAEVSRSAYFRAAESTWQQVPSSPSGGWLRGRRHGRRGNTQKRPGDRASGGLSGRSIPSRRRGDCRGRRA